jgi:CheY-like chemotaxis protein
MATGPLYSWISVWDEEKYLSSESRPEPARTVQDRTGSEGEGRNEMAEVLVVDDDDDIRDLIAMRVRRAGHHVTSLGDPTAAVALAAGTPLDLVLVDWSMPLMNGGQVCAALRAMPHLAGVPIMVVTAHADVEILAQAMAAGASGYLTKPFTLRDLDARIAEMLQAGTVPAATGRDGAA